MRKRVNLGAILLRGGCFWLPAIYAGVDATAYTRPTVLGWVIAKPLGVLVFITVFLGLIQLYLHCAESKRVKKANLSPLMATMILPAVYIGVSLVYKIATEVVSPYLLAVRAATVLLALWFMASVLRRYHNRHWFRYDEY